MRRPLRPGRPEGGGACYSGFIPLLCWLYSAAILLLFSCYSPAILLLFSCYSPAILLLFSCYSPAILALFRLYSFMPVLYAGLYAVRNARCRQRRECVVVYITWWRSGTPAHSRGSGSVPRGGVPRDGDRRGRLRSERGEQEARGAPEANRRRTGGEPEANRRRTGGDTRRRKPCSTPLRIVLAALNDDSLWCA